MSPFHQDVRHLYAHIPFCPTKCPYCAFVTHVGSTRLVQPYVEALRAELSGRASSLRGPLRTVYFGGGTPSMVSPTQVGDILATARECLGLAGEAEVTLEAHPNAVTEDSLEGFRSVGVNRLSIGVESLDGAVLHLAGRQYGPERIAEVMLAARRAGFDNVSLDLIYGLPGQTVTGWRASVQRLIALAPDHLSLYPLSIEPGTVFARQSHAYDFPADELVAEMYHAACDLVGRAGYDHYEVANWALPARRSDHNLAYWMNEPYAAVGVGAHGYLHSARYVNMRGVKRYIDVVAAGGDPECERERIDDATALDEFLMLRLRLLTEGICIDEVEARYGPQLADETLRVAWRLADHLLVADGRVTLREAAVPVANSVWSEFLGLYPGARPALDLVS